MIAVRMGADGVLRFIGDGTAKAVVTAVVVDNEKNRIGDLYDIADNAVRAWEGLMADFALLAPPEDS